MPTMLKNAANTKHISFSLYPSEIKRFRAVSAPLGSLGRALQVAAEVLYELAQRKKWVFWQFEASEEWLKERRDREELKAVMGCYLPENTIALIDRLASMKMYGSRSGVLSAVLKWLNDTHKRREIDSQR